MSNHEFSPPDFTPAAKKIGQDDDTAARLKQHLDRMVDGTIVEPLYSTDIARMLQASIETQMAANRRGREEHDKKKK
ncbi:MAG: hypothetical protein KBD46_01570 [Candidatus Levybacteria bacterium]|nr:hypothetical protein [Candidatus Levybacteria bacterium]